MIISDVEVGAYYVGGAQQIVGLVTAIQEDRITVCYTPWPPEFTCSRAEFLEWATRKLK